MGHNAHQNEDILYARVQRDIAWILNVNPVHCQYIRTVSQKKKSVFVMPDRTDCTVLIMYSFTVTPGSFPVEWFN